MKVRDKKEVIEVLKQNKPKFLAFGVERVGLFGSFVRDQQKEGSDVDLWVKFDPNKKNYRNFIGFSGLVERLLGRNVDLITDESLSKYIGPYIKREMEYV